MFIYNDKVKQFQFHYDLILLTINVYLQRQGKAISISL